MTFVVFTSLSMTLTPSSTSFVFGSFIGGLGAKKNVVIQTIYNNSINI